MLNMVSFNQELPDSISLGPVTTFKTQLGIYDIDLRDQTPSRNFKNCFNLWMIPEEMVRALAAGTFICWPILLAPVM